MTKNKLNDPYFEWMYRLVVDDRYSNKSYRRLFYKLHDTEFAYTIPMDGNRAEDGIELRYRFGREQGYRDAVIANCLDIRPCSILEMMIALAIRCEEHIMEDPDIGNRTVQWFWSIEDDPDIWTKVEFGENDPIQHFQCKRMSSLFKDVAEDGTVTYSDVNRVQLINKESPDIPFRNGFGTRLIDKMYPITLPYFPTDKKFKIIVEEFLTDEKNGDFDTVGYLQLIFPNGEVVDLNGYFKDGPDGMVRIEQAEYEERKANRIDKK